MVDVKYVIERPDDEIYCACELIKRFSKKNDIIIDLIVAYDFTLDNECGIFIPQLNENKIFINPYVCHETYMVAKDKGLIMGTGYIADLSIFSIVIHEFAHLICYNIYEGLVNEYAEEFPRINDRLYLNDYCDHTLDDELAEIITVFILNPYMLKMISKKHWKFLNDRFKSPVPASVQQFKRVYNDFSVDAKLELYEKFGITYNMDNNKFEMVNNENISKNNVALKKSRKTRKN